MTAACGEEIAREEFRALAGTIRVVRGVVRLDEDVVLCGGAGKRVEVNGVGGVVGVPDDDDIGGRHCAEERACVFLPCAGPDDGIMQARDGVVHLLQDALGQIDTALVVHDVQLRTHDDVDAVGGGTDDLEVAEVHLVEGAGERGRMVGDADEGEPLCLCRSRYLADGAVGVHAGDAVRVDVDDVGHGEASF